MKGIILAGGSGSRLYPATKAVSKQLLPVYDKPMIYYPLSTLMLAGIREILVISTPRDLPAFRSLLGDGSDFGLRLSYCPQPSPDGLAQAFILAEEFLAGSPACLILGDNIFHGSDFGEKMQAAIQGAETGHDGDATIFGYWVSDPERYGVAELSPDGSRCLSIEEKPSRPKSNYAVVGLYFYPSDVVEKAKSLRPSARGELEITDLNRLYLAEGRLSFRRLGRGFAWLDTGTPQSLSEASSYIETIENRQGLKIGCPEGIAFRNGWISSGKLRSLAESMSNTPYGQYLHRLLSSDL